MSNWHPKPRRPQDPNPLFQEDTGFTITKSADRTPLQKQRLEDGTPHTRGSQFRVPVGRLPQIGGPELYLEGVEKSQKDGPAPIDPDAVVKGFLGQDDDEDTEKAAPKASTMGEKMGAAAGSAVKTAGKVAGRVVGTAVGLSQKR